MSRPDTRWIGQMKLIGLGLLFILVLFLSSCTVTTMFDYPPWKDSVVESETGCLNLKREPVPCEDIEPVK